MPNWRLCSCPGQTGGRGAGGSSVAHHSIDRLTWRHSSSCCGLAVCLFLPFDEGATARQQRALGGQLLWRGAMGVSEGSPQWRTKEVVTSTQKFVFSTKPYKLDGEVVTYACVITAHILTYKALNCNLRKNFYMLNYQTIYYSITLFFYFIPLQKKKNEKWNVAK